MLLIIDESLTGMGRTGKWFGFEHYDIVPDILTTSKALGQGVPVAAVITTDEIAEGALANGFDQGATHMGDSFQCAVALANIEVIESENLLEKSVKMGALLKKGLEELQTKFEAIGEVRGKGLFLGLEIIESRDSRRPPRSTFRRRNSYRWIGYEYNSPLPPPGHNRRTSSNRPTHY
jgi:4-aminobutyrate aminotransferase-like enzyme